MKKVYITHRTFYLGIACFIVLITAVILKMTVFTDEENRASAVASTETSITVLSDTSSLSEVNTESNKNSIPASNEEPATLAEDLTEWENTIGVHVTGAVYFPDRVYLLPQGSRIEDAVAMAGGAVKEADLSSLNLADYVHDGEKIYVPRIGEDTGGFSEAYVTKPEGALSSSNRENGEETLTNLNLATKIELMELPGIGETMADRIIEYREMNGPFRSIDELINVEGIGENRFSKLKAYITI